MNMASYKTESQRGVTLLEVLIAIVISAFGLLGLAGLMSRMQVAEVEGYQRSQPLVLLQDMHERILAANPSTAAASNAYALGLASPLGTADAQPASCAGLTGTALDLCEWSNELKGAAETDAGGNNVGAMVGARGCIELVTAPDPTSGVCVPGTFRVSVVWQGLTGTAAPPTTCGTGLYGAEILGKRRAVAAQFDVGLHDCTPP